MDEDTIIELFPCEECGCAQRNRFEIRRLSFAVADNILENKKDVNECVNDKQRVDSTGFRMEFSVKYGEKIIEVRTKGVEPEWLFSQLKSFADR